MMMLCVLALWSAAFWSHEFLQPRTSAIFPRQSRARRLYQGVRLLAPCGALALCLSHTLALGGLYWLGLGGVAGIGTGVLIAVLKQKQGPARKSRPPL